MGLFRSLYVLIHSKGSLGVLIGYYASFLVLLGFCRSFGVLLDSNGSLLIFFCRDGC